MAYTRARAVGAWHDSPVEDSDILSVHIEKWEKAIFELKKNFIDPRDYLASPTTPFGASEGSTDDTAAFQAAANDAVGKTLLVPSDTFMVSQLVLPNECNVMGLGYGSRLKQILGAGYPNFIHAPAVYRCKFADFVVDCNNNGSSSGANGNAFGGYFDHCIWNNVTVENCQRIGLDIGNPAYNGGAACFLNRVFLSDIGGELVAINLGISCTDSWVLYNNVGSSGQAQMAITGGPFRIVGNHFNGSAINNVSGLVTGDATDPSWNIFEANIFEHAQQHSLFMKPSFGHIRIIGNHFTSGGYISSGAYDAIYMTGGGGSFVDSVTIDGNTFMSPTNEYCVHLDNCKNITIVGNEWRSAYLASVPVELGANCSLIDIAHNTPSNDSIGTGLVRDAGVATVAATTTSIVVTHRLGVAPTKVHVTPLGNPGGYPYVDTFTATTFTLHVNTPGPAADCPVAWKAYV